MVRLPMVKAVIFPSDLAAGDFRLAALKVRDPEIDVSLDRNGKLNLLYLIPEKQKESNVEEKGETVARKEEPGGKEQKFTVDSIRLSGGKVRFDDLRQLAVERASHVRDRLVASGKVEPGRIFLVEPKTLSPERKEKLRDSRVDFRIR